MSGKNGGTRNMTTGSPARHILGFAMPLMLGSLLQQLYNMVDSWVVGNYVSNAALAAVGLAYPIMYIYQCLFIGIGSGGTVTMFWGFVPGWAVGAAMSLFDYFSGRWKRFLPRTEEADRGQ